MRRFKRAPDPVWTRSGSKRLVRSPDYNFRFLQLPTEIKLLICKYLSADDIRVLSSISEDFYKFIDEHFICQNIHLPKDLMEWSDTQKRYILSLEVDFTCDTERDGSTSISSENRNSCIESLKLLNITQLREVALKSDLTCDCNWPYLPSRMWPHSPELELCKWFMEMSLIIFRSALHLQYVDFTLLRCEKSLEIVETLVNNTSNLKHVTLRNPMKIGIQPSFMFDEISDPFSFSLLRLVRCLLEKTKITSLHLLDYELYEYTEDPSPDLNSYTLKELFWRFPSGPESVFNMDAINSKLVCWQLSKARVSFNDNFNVCLYHLSFAARAFVEGLLMCSYKFKTYNRRPKRKYFYRGHCYCDETCPFYQYRL